MAQIRSKSENKNNSWGLNSRFRVGDTVNHNNYYWTNVTGFNSEPGTANDWVNSGYYGTVVGGSGLPPYVVIDGFLVKKGSGGNDEAIQVDDLLQGEWVDGDYIIAKVNSLPYTTLDNLSIYSKNSA